MSGDVNPAGWINVAGKTRFLIRYCIVLRVTKVCGLIILLSSRDYQRQCIKAYRGSLATMVSGGVALRGLDNSQANILPTADPRWRFLSSLIVMIADLVVTLMIVLVPPLLLA